ncbi:MAG: DUF2914 domain-containing protein [Betaproteobacteria bacterium]|jgi:hypothetical protein|nr:MAG: DUF2914 domain-containing protein [Betaproteobacteria bacterium]
MSKFVAVIVSLFLFVPALAFSAATVSEARIGRGIADLELVDETATFTLNETAYVWMRVVGGNGESVKVTWSNGDQSFDVVLSIGSDSWRTWSSKILHLAGEWTVSVTDAAGVTIYRSTLNVQ